MTCMISIWRPAQTSSNQIQLSKEAIHLRKRDLLEASTNREWYWPREAMLAKAKSSTRCRLAIVEAKWEELLLGQLNSSG